MKMMKNKSFHFKNRFFVYSYQTNYSLIYKYHHMGNTISRHRSRILIRMYNSGMDSYSLKEYFQECGETINLFDLERILSHSLPEYHIDLSNISIPFNKRLNTIDVISFLNTGKVPISWSEMSKEEAKKNIKNNVQLKQEQSIVEHENNITTNKDDKNEIMKISSSPVPSATTRSILKRHETVINERVVRTVSFQDGIEKVTIETDKTQCDKIRMECDDELAVREYTQQEQTEELEGNMATFIRATQEYVHLKSKEDEFEYVHSDIPKGEGDEYDTDDHDDESEDDDYC